MSPGRINFETARGEKIIFHPADAAEAAFLQEKLFEAGFTWAGGTGKNLTYLNECVQNGLVIMDGLIYHRTPTDTTPYTVCSVRQVDDNYLPPDQQLMLQMFNRLSARIDALSEKIDEIHKELYPTVEATKPGLKQPRG